MTAPPMSATPARYPLSGWVEAFLFVFAIAVLSVSYIVAQQVGAHPIALILTATIVSSATLLLVAKPGPDALRIILEPKSWLIGFGVIGMEVFYFMLLEHASPALGSLLVRLNIPLAMLFGWLLVARRPSRLAMLGAAVILVVVVLLTIQSVQGGHRLVAFGAALCSAVAFCLRTFATEFHPWNRAAKSVMEKLRVTGLVVLVTSLTSLALAGLVASLMAVGAVPALSVAPTFSQIVHPPTLLLGAFVGAVVLNSMAVLSFSAVVKITSENFTAVTAFTPMATLLVQLAAGLAGLIVLFPIEQGLLPAMLTIIAGVFVILYAARRP